MGIITVRLHNNVNVVMQVKEISIHGWKMLSAVVGKRIGQHLDYADVAGTNAQCSSD
jgi:hypothetical protein